MSDLEPYVCIFNNCSKDHTPFRDRNSWTAHMREEHAVQWVCKLRGHSPVIVDDEESYDEHLRYAHAGSFTEAQLPWLKKRGLSFSDTLLNHCPLCLCVPSDAELQRESLIRGSSLSRNENQIRSEWLLKHLATHLESISLVSLPWQDSFAHDHQSERTSSGQVERASVNETDISDLNFDDEKAEKGRIDVCQTWAAETSQCVNDADTDAVRVGLELCRIRQATILRSRQRSYAANISGKAVSRCVTSFLRWQRADTASIHNADKSNFGLFWTRFCPHLDTNSSPARHLCC